MGSSKKKKQVVGYDYFMAAIFGLCLKADKLLKIVYGDRVAWEGQATDQEITVDRADLFGGNSTGGSGGLKGSFVASMGKPDQLPNRVMRKYLGEDVYAHRGLVTLSMDKSYVASFSPQFRTLRCLVRHTAYDWYPDKAVIAGTQINPAHEIRDALINPDSGRQRTSSMPRTSAFLQSGTARTRRKPIYRAFSTVSTASAPATAAQAGYACACCAAATPRPAFRPSGRGTSPP